MKCGNCGVYTDNKETVKACYAGGRVPCGWTIMVWVGEPGEQEQVPRDCGSHVTFTDRGWSCEVGHEYTNMETRHGEGWEYAEDEEEAANLIKHGTDAHLTSPGHDISHVR